MLTRGDFSECSDSEFSCSVLTDRPLKNVYVQVFDFISFECLGRCVLAEEKTLKAILRWGSSVNDVEEITKKSKLKIFKFSSSFFSNFVIWVQKIPNVIDRRPPKLSHEIWMDESVIYLNKCLLLAAVTLRVSNSVWDWVLRTCLRFLFRMEDLYNARFRHETPKVYVFFFFCNKHRRWLDGKITWEVSCGHRENVSQHKSTINRENIERFASAGMKAFVET